MNQRKGIILAGGTGSRLFPVTLGNSKQLLPIYDKPMIYYSLSVLMSSQIKEVLVISNPEYINLYRNLLSDGHQWGINIDYIEQNSPDGIAQAYLLAENFLNGCPSALILGDNFFYGGSLVNLLRIANSKITGASIFGYEVSDPIRYGVISFDEKNKPMKITEKPREPDSNIAVTGLYFFDEKASQRAKTLSPSQRGELEITSLLEIYLREKTLDIHVLKNGNAWLDMGTHENLLDASNYVRTLQKRQGLLIGSPDAIAYQNRWISKRDLKVLAANYRHTDYGQLLLGL